MSGTDTNPPDDSLVDELPLVNLLGRWINSFVVAEINP